MFVVCCFLFVACWLLIDDCWLWVDGCWLMFVVYGSLSVVRYLWFVVVVR